MPDCKSQLASCVGPCMNPRCQCCQYLTRTLDKIIKYAKNIMDVVDKIVDKTDANQSENEELQILVAVLTEDNKRYAKTNSELDTKADKIDIAAVKKKTSSGKIGRPKGQKPTINRRSEHMDCVEEINCKVCPDCGSELSGVTDSYDRVVTRMHIISENIKYIIKRRWCYSCKKQSPKTLLMWQNMHTVHQTLRLLRRL